MSSWWQSLFKQNPNGANPTPQPVSSPEKLAQGQATDPLPGNWMENGSVSWIEDEGLLRDEGVLLGWAAAQRGVPFLIKRSEAGTTEEALTEDEALNEKVNAIKSYFEIREKKLLEELNQANERRKKATEDLDALIKEPKNYNRPGFYPISSLIKMLLLIATVIALLFTTIALVAPYNGDMGWALGIGIFFFGLLSVVLKSYLFPSKDKEDAEPIEYRSKTWQQQTVDWVLPLISTFVTIVWSLDQRAWYQSLAIAIFLIAMYYLLGRFFIKHIEMFQQHYQTYLKYHSLIAIIKACEDKAKEKQEGHYTKKCNAAIKIMTSEYFMARNSYTLGSSNVISRMQKQLKPNNGNGQHN